MSEALNTMFDNGLYLSDEGMSDDDGDDEDYIYGYLGERILHCLESRVDFPRKNKITGKSRGAIIEQSFLEDHSEDMDDGSQLINDLAFTSSSISSGTADHVSPKAEPEGESHSEDVSTNHNTISMFSHIQKHSIIQVCLLTSKKTLSII